jgi:hypothetical protein
VTCKYTPANGQSFLIIPVLHNKRGTLKGKVQLVLVEKDNHISPTPFQDIWGKAECIKANIKIVFK